MLAQLILVITMEKSFTFEFDKFYYFSDLSGEFSLRPIRKRWKKSLLKNLWKKCKICD